MVFLSLWDVGRLPVGWLDVRGSAPDADQGDRVTFPVLAGPRKSGYRCADPVTRRQSEIAFIALSPFGVSDIQAANPAHDTVSMVAFLCQPAKAVC